METELKLLSTTLISVRKGALDHEKVQHWVEQYETHQRLPLLPVFRYGRFARYRLIEGSEILAAAEALRLESLWVLALPSTELPFSWPSGFNKPKQVQQIAQSLENQNAHEKLAEANNFARERALGRSQKSIAQKFKVSRSYVNNLLQLAKLPELVKKAFLSGSITSSQARILSYEKKPERLTELLHWLVSENVSTRALERAVYHRIDINSDHVTLSHLARELGDHWQCPIKMAYSGLGIKITARPHVAQVAPLLEALGDMSKVIDLNWSKSETSDCAMINFVIPSQQTFSAWIKTQGLADSWEHDMMT